MDDVDFDRFKTERFSARRDGKTWYVMNSKRKLLHRLILKPTRGQVVDHINHDGLDNRRSNLRVCSIAQNTQNRKGANFDSITGVRGVGKNKNGWVVGFWKYGKHYYFGRYKTQKDAIKVAKIAIRSVYK